MPQMSCSSRCPSGANNDVAQVVGRLCELRQRTQSFSPKKRTRPPAMEASWLLERCSGPSGDHSSNRPASISGETTFLVDPGNLALTGPRTLDPQPRVVAGRRFYLRARKCSMEQRARQRRARAFVTWDAPCTGHGSQYGRLPAIKTIATPGHHVAMATDRPRRQWQTDSNDTAHAHTRLTYFAASMCRLPRPGLLTFAKHPDRSTSSACRH